MDEIMDIKGVALYLHVTPRTAYRLAKAKKLPAKKIGGVWRIHRAALEKFMGAPPSAFAERSA